MPYYTHKEPQLVLTDSQKLVYDHQFGIPFKIKYENKIDEWRFNSSSIILRTQMIDESVNAIDINFRSKFKVDMIRVEFESPFKYFFDINTYSFDYCIHVSMHQNRREIDALIKQAYYACDKVPNIRTINVHCPLSNGFKLFGDILKNK